VTVGTSFIRDIQEMGAQPIFDEIDQGKAEE
jgi:hypothetical protein